MTLLPRLTRSLALLPILAAGAVFAQSPAGMSGAEDGNAPIAPLGPVWEEISPSWLTQTSPLQVAVQPGNPSCIIVTSPWQAVMVTQDGGLTWSNPYNDFVYDPAYPTWWVSDVAFNPAAPNQVVAVTLAGAYWSDDSGRNWYRCADPTAGACNFLALSPNGTAVAGGLFGDLFVYDWVSRTWPMENEISDGTMLTQLSFDAGDPSWLHIANEGDIFWTTPDLGVTLSKNGRNLPDNTWAVVCDPEIPGRAHATVGPDLYLTTTGPVGGTWVASGTGLPGTRIMSLIHHPRHPNVMFAGTIDTGVFCSPDRGTTWHPVGLRGMNHGTVVDLAISPDDPRYLYATCHAGSSSEGGFYRLRIRP
jgi:hypothetical protein